ncbi:MAG: HAD-IIIC family phosphatase [Magnetospirillum sp. WYHS-4]
MTWSSADLPWLPRPPADYRELCRATQKTSADKGTTLRRLATAALDLNQLTRLAKAAGTDIDALAPLRPFRLGLLSNGTMDLVVPALVASALRHGVALQVVAAPFDQAMQWALDSSSPLHAARPDAVLLAFDHRAYGLRPQLAGAEEALAAALAKVATIRGGLQAGSGAPLIVQTLPPPPESLFGSYDHRLGGSLARLAEAFNQAVADSGDLLLDVAAIARAVGTEAWHDPLQWHMAKLPFAPRFVPLYADHVGRLLAAVRGLARKCLVLDLDNTLWGGVIGDDGLEGIEIGQGSAVGEAHLALQDVALDLHARGVVLAVCSKNDDEVARRPFLEHPDMLLKADHIAVFQANWTDKPTNLKAIAAALNIGLDALVFVDDNPAERAVVRRELLEVAVPELPPDPALYARTLMAAGYFEAVALSDDDRKRTAQYRDNARRAQLEASSTDLTGYLRSLDMTIHFAPFDALGRARIAQLINKSNQFNLTTRRYTEAEVARLEADPSCFTLQVRLADIFGDNGMIGVVVCRPAGADWEIDTWLMSCRVLGRQVENAVLDEIVRAAAERGVAALVGRYIPSGRNDLVRDHYAKLGFAAAGAGERGATVWRLAVADYAPFAPPMRTARG